MPERRLDRARFAKCRAMMERGATPGERAAGAAAASRVAAAAGLSLGEALRLTDDASAHEAPIRSRPRGPAPAPRRPYPWQQPPLRDDPISVEEILAQKAANLARLKRKAARERTRLREACAEQDADRAALREAQAERDRLWAEGKS
ncbi:hypothetical protein [Methylobacterium symbioticum]|uniref:Uncharacterized protein n=1 Tax=Methylobacterium symbioticum TaxID=2584084 RepID=A0A509EKE8_9HYPH|nr:hypothetical protein [Methylobacterium symbioticum]VUD74876.1 hypothetical protein MET9862_05509 [Methylobacterium symbioticum]